MARSAEYSASLCVFCCKETDESLTSVTESGLSTISDCCRARGCSELLDYIQEKSDNICVHNTCRKSFTDSRKILKLQRESDDQIQQNVKRLRSSEPAFDWKKTCFYCRNLVTVGGSKKDSGIRQAATLELRDTILHQCTMRGDSWALEVEGLLNSCNDLVAEEAIYHSNCHARFLQNLKKESESGIMVNRFVRGKDDLFERMCHFLESCCERNIFSVDELQQHMIQLVAKDCPACSQNNKMCNTHGDTVYSTKHIKRKLIDKYGSHITFAEVQGRKNIVAFKQMNSYVISDKWYKDRKEDNDADSNRIVETAAKLIAAEIRDVECDLTCYPQSSDCLKYDFIPPLLRVLLEVIVPDEIKRAALGHSLIQAARPRTVIAPAMLSLGIQLDHMFGSKYLVQHLARLGFSSSHDEVTKYKQSAVVCQVQSCPSTEKYPTAFTQWVGDNVDHNVKTIDGMGTFHGMGIISVATALPGNNVASSVDFVQRLHKRLPVQDMVTNRIIPIFGYFGGGRGLQDTCIKEITSLECSSIATKVSLLWHVGWFCRDDKTLRPHWNGFMQDVCVGSHSGKSIVTMLPLIDLKPTDETTIYSTLLFVVDQAAKLNIPGPCITFDQPLWLKAMEIISAKKLNIVCRLGGFHTLMSFLGSIGSLMAGTGLQELFEVIYGKDTVVHMLSGKAYSRAMRGHFLLESALTIKLLSRLIYNTRADPCDGEIADRLDMDEIKDLYKRVMKDKISVSSDSMSCTAFQALDSKLEFLKKNLASESRTAKLWLLYMQYIDIIKQFVIAERCGLWDLHLNSVSKMINLFAATGHNNYAKCTHLYLQTMLDLPARHPQLYDMFSNFGMHSIRRSDRFWGGLSSDLVIEQTMMRALKSRGGLTRGRGMSDSVRSVWVNTMHQCASFHAAMATVTGLCNESQDHPEVGPSRMKRDMSDIQKMLDWLNDSDPFEVKDGSLRSLTSGAVASLEDGINCDIAEEVGRNIVMNMKDCMFYDLTLKKADQIKTLAAIQGLRKDKPKKVECDKTSLFHRLVVTVERSPDIESHFKYELSPVPCSLFKDDFMRKPNKSALLKALIKDVPLEDGPSNAAYVLDGGALLHRVRWLKNSDYGSVAEQYLQYVAKHFVISRVSVIFDGYSSGAATKDHEHMRRLSNIVSVCPDILVEKSKPVIFDQAAFLANEYNKFQLIQMLAKEFEINGITTKISKGDADTDIVSTALNIAVTQVRPVVVVADDTDVFVMLVHHRSTHMSDIYFFSDAKANRNKIASQYINIRVVQNRIGSEKCAQLLAIHSVGGCDTTSAIYGYGKGRVFKILSSRDSCKKLNDIITNSNSSQSEVADAGLRLMAMLYGGNELDSLNKLRYSNYCKLASSSAFRPQPQRLPPSERAAFFHILRSHLQASIWKTLNQEILNPLMWGWKEVNEEAGSGVKWKQTRLVPIKTDLQPASDEVLNIVRCKCKTSCNSTMCSCWKHGLHCVTACTNCHGESCSNPAPATEIHSESETDSADESEDEINCEKIQATLEESHTFDDNMIWYDSELDWVTEEMVNDADY